MRWDAQQLANVAAHVGFDHDDTIIAAALALVTSGGIDHYDFRPGVPGAGHYVGLLGIDVDAYPWLDARELHVPTVNMDAAYGLCVDHQGWQWSPWWRAGQWQAYTDHAATAATRTYDAMSAAPAVATFANRERFADTLERIRRTRRLAITPTR